MNRKSYILFASLLASCSVNDSFEVSKNEGVGSVALYAEITNEVGATIASKAENSTYTIPTELVPSASDLKLAIYEKITDSESGTEYNLYKEYANLSAYDAPEMSAGDYTAIVSYGEGIDVESATNAFFTDTLDFTIVANESITASMNATLANSIVKLQVTDDFNTYFAGGATLKLSTEAGGSIELDFPLADDADESILFVEANTNLYVGGTAIKQDPGTGVAPSVTFATTKVGVANQGMMNNVIIDASDTGGASITITINGTITTVSTTTVDVNSGSITTETEE
ncbi:MAG: DUF4493 domain-containing protein [Rikenellaceae bacterium]